MSTRLPRMMRAEGYGLNSSVSFLMVINAGGVIGLLRPRRGRRRGRDLPRTARPADRPRRLPGPAPAAAATVGAGTSDG
ncbi:hypothetical protein ABIE67_007357 [Streptomyces sp. V4I8]|uniref:hypothetical protein n=1 Tax=Streptomyces sp. V4I8 TaxID=3156469 RepID=UPI0035167CF8